MMFFHRWNWLVVDGKRIKVVTCQLIKNRRGLVRFNIPDEYKEYLGLAGISFEPATAAEAEVDIQKSLESKERLLLCPKMKQLYLVGV